MLCGPHWLKEGWVEQWQQHWMGVFGEQKTKQTEIPYAFPALDEENFLAALNSDAPGHMPAAQPP